MAVRCERCQARALRPCGGVGDAALCTGTMGEAGPAPWAAPPAWNKTNYAPGFTSVFYYNCCECITLPTGAIPVSTSYSRKTDEKTATDTNGTTEYSITHMNCALARKIIMTTFTSKWFQACL